MKRFWISEHPFVVIGVLLAVCLGPFLDKAIHTDDVLFVWTGEWIQRHPADFFGFEVNWWRSAIPMWVANCNPPLMSYLLAGVASVFGWNEIVLHLAGLGVAFLAAAGIYTLARMWCDRPMLATVITMFTPAFLVSSTTLMSDVLMLTFWIWALVFWERALAGEPSRWGYVGAGVLAGLAVLTKYSAITLLPLLPLLSLLRTRRLGWGWLGWVAPLMMVAGYEWLTARMYGRGLLLAAVHYTQAHRIGFSGGWKAKGIISLAFAGGSLMPVLFFAPWLWRRRVWLGGGVVIIGLLLGMFRLGGGLGLIHPWGNPELMNHWGFVLQVMLLTAGGLHLLGLVGAEAWRGRDINTLVLVLWIGSGLIFASVLNWTVNARSFLPIAPAVAILLVRRLGATRGKSMPGGRLVWPLIPAAAIALSLVIADFQLANSARTAAERMAAKYKPANDRMWFESFGGFEYYMEKLGGQPLDVERSLLQPGDRVVVPWLSGGFVSFPAGSVGWVGGFGAAPFSWMNLMASSRRGAAGFYDANSGPVPFVIGGIPVQDYFVVQVFSRVQYHTQPGNPREVEAGGVPSFPNVTFEVLTQSPELGKSEAMEQVKLAGQLEAEGKVAEAIHLYREALDVDSNNAVALNHLARILATAGKPEWRNGGEAVRLATRAVALTDRRLPLFIETLATAYAETGQFPKACETAHVARVLALVTGQQDIADASAKLWELYSSGKTAYAAPNP